MCALNKCAKILLLKIYSSIDLINPILRDYRSKISELEDKLSYYNAKSLAYYLESGGLIKAEDINVIDFGHQQIERLREEDRGGSAPTRNCGCQC